MAETGGGGGWGDPYTREPERVEQDAREGYVTAKGAFRDYGVVLDPETLAVDMRATHELRLQPRPPRPAVDRGPEAEAWLRRLGETG